MRAKLFLVIFFVILVFIEFFRDYVFINTNLLSEYLIQLNNGLNPYNLTDSLFYSVFNTFSTKELSYLKWIATVLFFIIYLIVGGTFSKLLWAKEKSLHFIKIYFFGGLCILLFSLIFYMVSTFLKAENQFIFYYISIELAHFVQSSLYPLTFLLMYWALNIKKT